jgi:hypothetical protein
VKRWEDLTPAEYKWLRKQDELTADIYLACRLNDRELAIICMGLYLDFVKGKDPFK